MKNIIVSILLLFICCKKNDNPNNHKFIYTLNEELTEEILIKYNDLKNKKNYYSTLNVSYCCNGNDRMIGLHNGDDDKKINILLKKTNRFLKLTENIFIPVISTADILFEEETKNLLISSLGKNGSIYFIIDGRDRLIEIR